MKWTKKQRIKKNKKWQEIGYRKDTAPSRRAESRR